MARKGKEIERLIAKEETVPYLTDSLAGVLKKDIDPEKAKMDRVNDKYEIADQR